MREINMNYNPADPTIQAVIAEIIGGNKIVKKLEKKYNVIIDKRPVGKGVVRYTISNPTTGNYATYDDE